MGFLSADNQNEIKHLFEGLAGEVQLIYFTQKESPLFIPGHECETCKDTRTLLEEVAGLSDKIKLEVHDFVAETEAAREHGVLTRTLLGGALQVSPALVITREELDELAAGLAAALDSVPS